MLHTEGFERSYRGFDQDTGAAAQGSKGFTLIELLVVVTIIVVLLALLVPGMDKAIHQSELAVCASQLRAVGSGAIVYAHDNRRHYPYRPGVHDPQLHDYRPIHLTYSPLWGQQGNHAPSGYDDRPTYRPYFPLKALMCPKTDAVDLDGPSSLDTTIFVSYPMWFGYRYTDGASGGKGMMRVGDRFTWAGERFNVLAGDLVATIFVTVQSSQPDVNGFMPLDTADSEDSVVAGKITQSTYVSGSDPSIGLFDPAYVRDDGSVQRYEKVHHNAHQVPEWWRPDGRFSKVPSGHNLTGSDIVVPKGS